MDCSFKSRDSFYKKLEKLKLNKLFKLSNNRMMNWKSYAYFVISSEISSITLFFDKVIQLAPLRHDKGTLFKYIKSKNKATINKVSDLKDNEIRNNIRSALIVNGNFNYQTNIKSKLEQIKSKISRFSRLFIVVYNPYYKYLYYIANKLRLRNSPIPWTFLTKSNLEDFAKFGGFEVVRIKPSVFCPLYIPLISNFFNRVCPTIPLVRNFAFVWIVVLRPVVIHRNASLSVIIPARNEAGNIFNAVSRLPDFNKSQIEIIFVEGGSSDDTWEKILEVKDKFKDSFNIRAFQQTGQGKHDAVRMGLDNATCDLVTILDADLTMPPRFLSYFYDAYCAGLGDFINGDRLLYQMESGAMRPLNYLGNIFYAKLLSFILDTKLGDSLCGTKMFCLNDYKRFVIWRERFGDYDPFGDFEMLFAAASLCLGVFNIPIRYRARSYGCTQISRFRDGLRLFKMALIGFFKITLGKIK